MEKKLLMALLWPKRGFNFHYYTNVYTTKSGASYFFCYEQGYLRIENDKYMLVHKQDYVK